MTVRRWDPETLYGPESSPAGIPAAGRREPLHVGPLVGPAQDGPAHREPLHVRELAEDHPRGVSPCTCPPLELPAHTTRAGCPVHDIAARIRAELADALAQEIERADHAALYGNGTGGPLVGILQASQTDQDQHEADQDQQDQHEARHEHEAGRRALVAELAADVVDQAARLELDTTTDPHALQLDARDRHAVAILAEHGPVLLTGRPVHALQLADGRAFTLQHEHGRPTWQPTGPRPLIGDQDAHEWQCPQCGATTRARMADRPQDRPELAQWDRIRADQRQRSTSAQHDRQERAQDAARELAAARRTPRPYRPHEDGPAPVEPMPLPVADAARRPCRSTHCPWSGPCSPDSTCGRPGRPVDDVEPCTHSRPTTGPRAGRCPVDCPGSAGTRGHEPPQEAAPELAGPRGPGDAPQAGTGPQDGRACQLGACPYPTPCPAGCTPGSRAQDRPEHPRAWIARALDAAPGFEVAGSPVHAFELADGSRYRLTPAGWQPQDDEPPQDTPQDVEPPALPQLPGRIGWPAPTAAARARFEACSTAARQHEHERRPSCTRGAPCPFPVPCVGPCHLSTRARAQDRPADVDDAHELDDVDDLADLARVQALPERFQPARPWSGPRYAQRVEAAAILHREPLHAFTAGPDLWPTVAPWPAPGKPAAYPWPAPDERPGDREALHALQDVDQDAHAHVRAVAQACTCTTRQREDPPCPVAADDAAERAHARVRAHLEATLPGPPVAGPPTCTSGPGCPIPGHEMTRTHPEA